jgi:hypothetical protein
MGRNGGYRIYALVALFLAFGPVLPVFAQTQNVNAPAAVFFENLDDMPVMPGLTEQPDEGMVFDQPGGTVAEAAASGPVTPGAIRDFYARTLPQLGWRDMGNGRYARQGEILALTASAKGPDTLLHISLSPASR